MLPPAHCQRYEQFQQQLQTLHQTMTQPEDDRPPLKASVASLQQFFQAEILTLNADELPVAIAHFVQSYQVEMDKQLRLLAMDAQFLQAARQAATASHRQQQIRDRLETLIRYCNAVLGEPASDD
jgi:septum formation inhibitor MinC